MGSTKYILRNALVQAILCYLASLYIRFVYATGDWRIEGESTANRLHEAGSPFVLAFWHGRLLMMSYAWRYKSSVNMLISGHPDGRFVAQTMAHFGVPSIIGSTTRGGWNAMRSIAKTLRNGGIVGITPDGPQGPRMRVSDGVITIARLARAPILPLACSASRRKVFATWDRFMLPLPFTRGIFLWGNPIQVPAKLDENGMEEKKLELEKSLVSLANRADQLMGQTAIEQAPLDFTDGKANITTKTSSKTETETPIGITTGFRR